MKNKNRKRDELSYGVILFNVGVMKSETFQERSHENLQASIFKLKVLKNEK